jgi:hypothetical protein
VKVALAALFLALAAGAGWWIFTARLDASPDDPVYRGALARVDADGDGCISRAEWTRYCPDDARTFEAYDFNGDGRIDLSEFKAMFAGSDPGYSQPHGRSRQ